MDVGQSHGALFRESCPADVGMAVLMAAALREVERKYDADPGTRLPDLSGLPEVVSQSEPDELILEATYYDTEDLDLARAGITLRRRLGGQDAGWHLKLPESPDTRTELRLPHAPEPPQELVDLLTARVRGRRVRPVARITTTRLRRMLRDRNGAALAEVVVDDVTAEALGPQTTLSRWHEVEFELVDGGPALLKAADRRLRRNGLRRSRRTSKLHTAMAGRLAEPRPRHEPDGSSSAGEVVFAYLRGQEERLLACDVMVRRDQPDAVHQMRVASRRIRSALHSFSSLLPPDEVTALSGELRWLARLLGEVRDREMLHERLAADIAALPVELVLGPVSARVTGYFASELAASRERLLEALGSARYLALLDRLGALLAQLPDSAAARQPSAKALAPLVGHEMKRARRRMRGAAKAAAGTQRDVVLHEARKAVKRTRYAVEAVIPVFGKAARRTARALEKVQAVIGDHQDTVIARTAIRQLAVRAHADHENAFSWGLLYERQANRAASLREHARKACTRAERRKLTAWMRTL